MHIPDVIESITVLAAYEQYAALNEGDEATTDILLNMTADILAISPDRVLELIEENKAAIDIINS